MDRLGSECLGLIERQVGTDRSFIYKKTTPAPSRSRVIFDEHYSLFDSSATFASARVGFVVFGGQVLFLLIFGLAALAPLSCRCRIRGRVSAVQRGRYWLQMRTSSGKHSGGKADNRLQDDGRQQQGRPRTVVSLDGRAQDGVALAIEAQQVSHCANTAAFASQSQ